MTLQRGDPFGEVSHRVKRRRLSVLGCEVEFTSEHRGLLALAAQAFAGLPVRHPVSRSPRLSVHLRLAPGDRPFPRGQPPRPVHDSGAGLLVGSIDAANFALIAPAARAALVSASERMLRHEHLLRYELIEFAVLTLAARVRGLTPLHAGCVGMNGRGALLLGASGAGKSTLAIQGLAQGLDYLAEDSVFIDSRLRANAVPAFVHARCDSRDAAVAQLARGATVICRRSGVRKYEIDLRKFPSRIAVAPLPLAAVIVLSRRAAGRGPLLRALSANRVEHALGHEQPYAGGTREWRDFRRRVSALPAFEMRRGTHPRESALALRAMLASLATTRRFSP